MEYMYLWGIGQAGLIVLGPYDGEHDQEYQKRRAIMVRGGVTPKIRWLGTRDQAAATQMIKHEGMGVTGQLETGTNRARHDIKQVKVISETTFGGDNSI
jgi:hypothetical protein